jgi:cytochrome c peroxidase
VRSFRQISGRLLLVAAAFTAAAPRAVVSQESRGIESPLAPLPPVPVPSDNPQTAAKVELGRALYFDPRLSGDNTISCASCHVPELGWANHDRTDTGIRGRVGKRNSGTVLDAAYMKHQFWDGRAASLEEQALGPIHNPVEMGETLDNVVRKLQAIPEYRAQFRAVFGTDVTTDGIAKAIASFERTIVSGPTPLDRHLGGDGAALGPAARRGLALFEGKANCIDCHNGPTLSDQSFHNIGVGMDAREPDLGREEITKQRRDRGKFKTPGLRNVARTSPYFHDGSAATLRDVVRFYDGGGIRNPDLDPSIKPLALTPGERDDLVAFLAALSGPYPIVEAPRLPSRTQGRTGARGARR